MVTLSRHVKAFAADAREAGLEFFKGEEIGIDKSI